jgi:hypothetical protein
MAEKREAQLPLKDQEVDYWIEQIKDNGLWKGPPTDSASSNANKPIPSSKSDSVEKVSSEA